MHTGIDSAGLAHRVARKYPDGSEEIWSIKYFSWAEGASTIPAEELHRSTNFESWREIPAASKIIGVLWFWLWAKRFYHTACWETFLPKDETKPICRAKGVQQEKNIFLCSQGPAYNQRLPHWKLKQEGIAYKTQHFRGSPGGVIASLDGCCSFAVDKASGMPDKVLTIANATQLYLLKNYRTVHFHSSSLPDVSETKVLQSWLSAEALLLMARGL